MGIYRYFSMIFSAFPMLIAFSQAHSWVEELRVLNTEGTMAGQAGHIRGAVPRLAPAFTDLNMQYLLPPNGRSSSSKIYSSDLMCKTSQSFGNYSTAMPRLQAMAGDYIALRHQENGHVTLPENTPQKNSSGIIYVYGTAEASDNDKFQSIHPVWDEQGTGGDRRGRLLAMRPFDDGQCYQVNNGEISTSRQAAFQKVAQDPQGADLWCQVDIRLPLDINSPLYTLYWVWDWPSAPTSESPSGEPEIYTSCIDIDILPGIVKEKITFKQNQDLNWAAIKEQLHS